MNGIIWSVEKCTSEGEWKFWTGFWTRAQARSFAREVKAFGVECRVVQYTRWSVAKEKFNEKLWKDSSGRLCGETK